MPVKITVRPNSSLLVEGDFSIVKADGTEIPHQGEKAFLCRCGQSMNKPFCDSSHKKVNFQAE